MNQQHPIGEFTKSALDSLRGLVDVNTIVGDPISTTNGVVVIPVSKVSFGYGSGGSDIPSSNPKEFFGGGTGGGVTIQPLAFLVISGGEVSLLPMPTADNTGDRIVNAVPGVIDKVTEMIKDFKKEKEAKKEAKPE